MTKIELEPLRPNEFARVAGWLSDPDIQRWLVGRWQGKTFTEQHIAVMIAGPATEMFLIRTGGAAAGLVTLSSIDRAERTASVWYLVDADHRGQGLAGAALHASCRKAFGELGLVALNAWITVGNDASRRVLERVGFREAGLLRSASLMDGKNVDRLLFDILPEDVDRADITQSQETR